MTKADIKGKTAFITGGASGLGLGTAKVLANAGVNVVLADFRQSALDEATKYFADKGQPALGVKLDVTDRAEYAKAADAAEAKFGKIHILFNNAGIGIPEGNIWEDKWEDIDLAIDVNYRGILNGIKTILPRILAHGEWGYVISTASKAAIVPVPKFTLYNSLKMGVVTVMETLKMDLEAIGSKVGSAVFCPGGYTTNLGQSSGELRAKHLGVEIPQMPPPPPPPKDGDAPQGPPPGFEMPDFSKIMRIPEEAGERILRAMLRGDMYILTHSEFKKGWDERAAAISRAFPDQPQNEDYKKIFAILMGNEVFNKQTQVPGYTYGDEY
ncbi:MAG: SDR family NAD(P)-dependent oxidoreductase [Oscillospiraceae bacterium]|jgi:NAD(P)-dependent dehydrogenase (short-subunit alcohol dehydrogenase family)|nr:SDR family NAD(P)-dependent oxidoreductase [Oscillospiraceae bacterium]